MIVIGAIFAGLIILVQRGLRYLSEHWVTIDNPYYWPVSVFNPRLPSVRDLVVAVIVLLAFAVFVKYLESKQYSLGPVMLAGVLLIAGLTLIHGAEVGFYAPVAGDAQSGVLIPVSPDGQEYYHDALKVTDPADFIRRYNEVQPTLHRHTHTHPPGAVLTFYFLQRLLGDPALIALVIMLAATITTVFFVYKLMQTELKDTTARYMALLIVLLPAVQIYYLATLDALITALLTGTLYLFCFGRGKRAVAGAIALLIGSFFLTFVSLFILPVLVGFDLIVKRSPKRSVIVITAVLAAYILLYLASGYDALQSFRTASQFENQQGFMLFVDPVNYFFTRLEDIAEILLFFGPFLLILLIRGLRQFRLRPLYVLTALGCLTLLGMYAVGAWRTGETARACAFIYPYLLFPVGHYLDDSGAGSGERLQLATLVFVQSLAMQTFGNYHW
jgi:hypothetical protein